VGGGVVHGETVPDLAADLHPENVSQRLAAVNIEIVHDQVDRLSVRVLQGQFAGDSCELEGPSDPAWRR